MRILFFSSIFPQPHNRLRGIYSLHLCRALARSHQVKVVAPWSWIDQLRCLIGGASAHNALAQDLAGLQVHYPFYFYPPKLMRSAYAWFMWLSARDTLVRMLSQFRPECIVSYWTHPDGAVAVRAAREAAIPSAVMVGGSDILLMPRRGTRRAQTIRVLNEADVVLPVGVQLRQKILRLGIPAEKIQIIPRGVDRDLFSPGSRRDARRRLGIPHDKQVLLCVGNMVYLKGIDVLLAAYARLARTRADVWLYLIGQGPLRHYLEAECQAHGLSSITTFVGSVHQTCLPDWYRAANLTVLPSRSEGVPNVLRESLACGTPFVASRTGGIPELAGDPVSVLVPPGDPEALAEGIARALAKAANGIIESNATRSWDESANRLTTVLSRLVTQNPTAPLLG